VRAALGTAAAKAAVDDAAPAFLARAQESIALGDRSEALRIFDMLSREFGPAASPEQRADWAARAAELRASAALTAEVAAVSRIQGEEAQREERAKRTLGELLAVDPVIADVAATARKLEIDRLRTQVERSPERLLRESAARTLASLQGQTGFYMSRELLARGDPARAALLLELSTRVNPDWGWNWAGWAAALAKAGRAREAMAALKRAVELGPITKSEVAADPDFAALRERRDFQTWLAEPAPPTRNATPRR
jgi:tetratricopeptide (TPR) repeat protein